MITHLLKAVPLILLVGPGKDTLRDRRSCFKLGRFLLVNGLDCETLL